MQEWGASCVTDDPSPIFPQGSSLAKLFHSQGSLHGQQVSRAGGVG